LLCTLTSHFLYCAIERNAQADLVFSAIIPHKQGEIEKLGIGGAESMNKEEKQGVVGTVGGRIGEQWTGGGL
jgi:hypothetical protein